MKKIVIDARYLGMSGIGRFLEGILDNLDFSLNEYFLIGKKERIEKYSGVKYIYDNTSPYFPKSILKLSNAKLINSCDIFYSPNFVIPFNIKIKSYVMLHDIIFLDMSEVNKNFLEKKLKKILIKRALKKSEVLFTASLFSKKRILHYFPKYDRKIEYYYTGVDNKFKNYNPDGIKENNIVFVGNIKKNKGLKTLLEAFSKLNDGSKLTIIGDASNFKNGDSEVTKYFTLPNVVFTGFISDEEMLKVVSHAKYLVQPSLYEGFGLPPLEALYLNTEPILSDIEVLKEVYEGLPVKFFKVGDSLDLKEKLEEEPEIVNIDKEELNKKFSHKNFTDVLEKKFKE